MEDKFSTTVCSDCSFPPNHVVTQLRSKTRGYFSGISCRDCGDYWEEYDDSQLQEEEQNDL